MLATRPIHPLSPRSSVPVSACTKSWPNGVQPSGGISVPSGSLMRPVAATS